MRRFFAGFAPFAGAAAVLLLPRAACAQEDRNELLSGKHRTMESSQQFAYELRFASFEPGIDTNPSLHGETPYKTAFGGSRLLFGMEFDWEALRIPNVGTLGPGFGIGYTKASGLATFQQPHANPDGTVSTTSGESTSLEIYPMYAVAVFRVDVLWRQVHVPLVPYAKFGIGYAIWRASNELGTSNYNGQAGVGASLGTQLGLGLAFNLNSFDEYSAKNFDDAVGVNNTYVFAEYTRSDLDGLGIQADPMRVGGQSWTFGLTVEF
ncbi:MAG TPA: MXAN_2562 family outer membrane beta-barrel protein [Polyangiaceae bacterium]|jgi:hypothetical protein